MRRIKFDPMFDSGVRGWILKHARKNLWRVSAWYELDDLVQDGYMCFFKVRQRYLEVDDPKHIMALFKTTYRNHVTDLAAYRYDGREIHATPGYETQFWDKLLGTEMEEATLFTLVSNAPEEVRAALNLLFSDAGRALLCLPYERDEYGVRESTNQKFCRALGYDSRQVSIVSSIKDYFSDEPNEIPDALPTGCKVAAA